MSVEVEEGRQFPRRRVLMARVGQARVGIAQLIEERMDESFDGGQTLRRCVFEKPGDEVDGIVRGAPEDLRGEEGSW